MDIAEITIKLIAVIILVALNGFFVAAEFAIVKMRSSRIDSMINAGVSRAHYAKKLVDHLDVSLSVTQLGITLASLGLGWLGEPTVSLLLMPVFDALGIGGTAIATTISFIISFSIITSMHIILGELIPKNIAIQQVERVTLAVSLPLLFFQRIMYPSVWVLNHVAAFTAKCLGIDISGSNEDAAHTEDEIMILMEQSHKQGYIDKQELEYVDNVFDFADRYVREIMIPRTDMKCLYMEDTVAENMETIVKERMTRYPMCREDKDHIIGFIHVKDLMMYMHKHRLPRFRQLIRKTLVVPETMKLSMLLQTMQKQRSQLAIVVDEYGGTAGMVTIEDLIEEIVGEIQDEFDQERPAIEKRGDRVYSIDAMLLIEEVSDTFEIEIEADNIDTIGGWVYSNVQPPPQIGMMASWNGAVFFVEEMDNLRITRLLVKLDKDLKEEHDEIVDLTGIVPEAASDQ